MNYGFVRVAAAAPLVKVADCEYNCCNIEEQINKAAEQGVEIITFPELAVTGYTCEDLFTQPLLLEQAEVALKALIAAVCELDIIVIVGAPVAVGDAVINAAVVFQRGKILGVVPKTYLPNYKEYSEMRWFAPARQIKETETTVCGQTAALGTNLIFKTGHANFAIEICEDLWAPVSPSTHHALSGADLIFNLSAENEVAGKYEYLTSLIKHQSAKSMCGYIYASSGFGESSTDLVFAGNAIICELGEMLGSSPRFAYKELLTVSDIDIEKLRNARRANTTFTECKTAECITPQFIAAKPQERENNDLIHPVSAHPFIKYDLQQQCAEMFEIQVAGLVKRLVHTNCRKAVVGISGGLDSTLALLVAVEAMKHTGHTPDSVIGVTMPGFGTTDRTYNNALTLMEELGVQIREVSIKDACIQHFKDIKHDIDNHDVTYENSQARERTQILMDIANQASGMVIGTGDLSELALGWATYNGDHMSMYGVNASIPKTLVQSIVRYRAECSREVIKDTLLDIVNTPISPELTPADENGNIKQKTEDLVGPYELHDFFLYHFVVNQFSPKKIYFLAEKAFAGSYDSATIKHWLTTFCRRFFNQQFKRSCLPDGPKVCISLSPRGGDWKMPSDACSQLWLNECEEL